MTNLVIVLLACVCACLFVVIGFMLYLLHGATEALTVARRRTEVLETPATMLLKKQAPPGYVSKADIEAEQLEKNRVAALMLEEFGWVSEDADIVYNGEHM